jgi:acyl-CoA dehydrogenase
LDKDAGRGAIKAFVVMKGTPGFELAKKEEKMGIRVSDTAAFVMKDCRVPKENLLGMDEEIKTGGGGFKGLMKTFNLTRPAVAATGTGCVLGMQEFATDELKKEGVEVDWEAGPHRQSAIQEKLIELETQLEAATLTSLRASWLMDKGKPNNLESAVCKVKGGDVCRSGAQIAIELLGALGISHDYMVEKWFRDARITDIYEGTGEINRLVTARAILNYSSADLM